MLPTDPVCVRRYKSTRATRALNIRHHDVTAFPRELTWFNLLEAHVLATSEDIVVYESSKTDEEEHVTLPLMRKRIARFGGSYLIALQNFYTPDYRPLCSSRAAAKHICALVNALVVGESPDVVSLSPLDSEALETDALFSAFKANGFAVETRSATVNWIHVVEGSYKQYIAQRSKRVQNTLKRRTRQLAALDNASIEIFDGRSLLPRLLHWYDEVYSRSWKTPEPFPEFMPALIRQTAEAGTLRLGFVRLAEQPIAVHFWIVCDGCAFIYKLAHDKAFDKLSPGTVLMAEMLRQVIDVDGVKRIDFLTGDDAYKRDWMSQRRVKIEMRAYNGRRFWGIAALLTEKYIKPFVKQFRNRARGASGSRERAVD